MTTAYHSKNTEKMRLIMTDRALSLVKEDYWLVTISSTETMWFAKLRHRTNGNVVTMVANLLDMTFTQKRNNKIVVNHQKIL